MHVAAIIAPLVIFIIAVVLIEAWWRDGWKHRHQTKPHRLSLGFVGASSDEKEALAFLRISLRQFLSVIARELKEGQKCNPVVVTLDESRGGVDPKLLCEAARLEHVETAIITDHAKTTMFDSVRIHKDPRSHFLASVDALMQIGKESDLFSSFDGPKYRSSD